MTTNAQTIPTFPFAYASYQIITDKNGIAQQLLCQENNEAFASIWHTTPEMLIGKSIHIPNFNLLEQLRQNAPLQTLYQHESQQYKVETQLQGDYIRCFFIRISAEIQIYSQNQTIIKDKQRDAEAQFLRMLYASDDAMLLIENAVFVECNEAVARFLGYKDKSEFLLQPPAALSPEYQPDGMRSADKAELMNAQAIRKGYHRFEWMHLKADGSEIPVEVSLSAIVYQGRSILHCVWRDLSEQKRLEKELQQQQERLLLELSAPITQIWKNILFMPLVGHINPQRIQTILHTALEKIAAQQAKVFIIDINGIYQTDNQTAHLLIKLAKAAPLMGCRTILSGISPAVAQTICESNFDTTALHPHNSLQDSLRYALHLTAQQVSL